MTTTAPNKPSLRLVPTPPGSIDADMVAFTVMEHIDTMYPGMWLAVPKSARVSVRNTIIRAIKLEETKS
ncbi:hypothetical protein D3C87_1452880 [compost metagenome]